MMRNLGVWLYAVAVLALGLVLRIWNLGAESPSFEEISASLAAVKGIAEYPRSPELDLCPPLFYAVLHPLTWAGGSLGLMRLPSVIGGAVAATLLYLLGRRVFPDRGAAIGAFLLAANPLHVYFSQEVQPAVLFTVLLIVAFYFMVRSAETASFRDWLFFDLAMIGMLHLHPKAVFVAVAFLILHLIVIPVFANPADQRRVRATRKLGMLAFNYVVITAVSLPWLFIMPTKSSWREAAPGAIELARAFIRYPFFGMVRQVELLWLVAVGVVLLLLLPPFLNLVRQMSMRLFLLVALVLLIPLLPFAYSYFGRVRFSAPRDAVIVAPLFCLLLGLLLGKCIFYMRTVLILVLAVAFGWSVARQAVKPQKLDWNQIRDVVETAAKPGGLLVYWPDMTKRVGEYYFGSKYQIAGASDLLDKWADSAAEEPVVFVVTQNFPSPEPYIYTFPGALRQYAKTEFLWQHRLNFVARSTDMNMFNLRLWFDEPQSLNIVDAHTSQTQFIYTPTHEVFRNSQFHWDEPDMSYEMNGRRIVWTAAPQVDLKLPVTLSPGDYIMKLHCSPDFEQAEYGNVRERKVSVHFWTGMERRKTTIEEETTVNLRFSVETEVKSLPVHIEVEPTELLGHPKRRFGIKIYSIAIDEAVEQPGGTGL
jgi:hypothetical protein